MARARGVGGAAFKMQLRSRKRDLVSSAATISSNSGSPSTPRKKKAATAKSTSQGSICVKPKVVAPSSSKFPLLTALKNRVNRTPNESKVMLTYPNLTPARLLRRYKRFLADVVLLDGTVKDESQVATEVGEGEEADAEEVITVYCPNTGPMVGLLDGLPNARVQLSKSNDPKRKYAYTLEMIQIHVRTAGRLCVAY
jgi:sugar fermentation stimulation protein A